MEHLRDNVTILCTHQLQFIRKADLVLVLKDGKSLALGTYDELISSGLDFVELLRSEEKEAKTTTEPKPVLPNAKSISPEAILERQLSRQRSRALTSSSDVGEEMPYQPRVADEVKAIGSVSGEVYWNYVK